MKEGVIIFNVFCMVVVIILVYCFVNEFVTYRNEADREAPDPNAQLPSYEDLAIQPVPTIDRQPPSHEEGTICTRSRQRHRHGNSSDDNLNSNDVNRDRDNSGGSHESSGNDNAVVGISAIGVPLVGTAGTGSAASDSTGCDTAKTI